MDSRSIDIKKMFNEGGKDFDKFVSGAGDSDDSGDEYPDQSSSMKKAVNKDIWNKTSHNFFTRKNEDKGRETILKKMFGAGGKGFDLSVPGAGDSDDSGNEYEVQSSSVKKTVNKNHEKISSDTKVENKWGESSWKKMFDESGKDFDLFVSGEGDSDDSKDEEHVQSSSVKKTINGNGEKKGSKSDISKKMENKWGETSWKQMFDEGGKDFDLIVSGVGDSDGSSKADEDGVQSSSAKKNIKDNSQKEGSKSVLSTNTENKWGETSWKKMFEEGGKDFDLFVSGAGDSGDEDHVQSSSVTKNVNDNSKKKNSDDVISTKVENKWGEKSWKKMFDEGGKDFDLFVSGAGDSDDSGDEYQVQSSSEKKTVSEEKNISYNVLSTKVEDKGKEISFNDIYVDMSVTGAPKATQERHRNELVEEVMKKSIIGPGFEKLESVPPYEISKRKLLQEKRKKRESTKGESWFNMSAAEITDEIKHDLQVLKMRSILDPKQFYKKNTLTDSPKFFQMGTVVESAADFYSSRIPKKQRKQTMVEELLADAEFQRFNKQRYKEIIEERRKTTYKAHRHANRLKRKGNSKQ